MTRSFFYILLLFFSVFAQAQNTEKMMLSGQGYGQTVDWDFYCSAGANSGKWSKIAVPSNWELQGFGEYTYGRWYKDPNIKQPSMETGLYKYEFRVPVSWKNQDIQIVFEGVMTDTEVKINGKLAGEVHQGGFYRFSYDITKLLRLGEANQLEVKVSKHSAEKSVNSAERRADWWLFGGIYRPVYLEAKPKQHIENVAIYAQYDGKLDAEIELSENKSDAKNIVASLISISGKKLGSRTFSIKDKSNLQKISMTWDNIAPWTCETPNLYFIQFDLLGNNNKTLHSHKERIGFRTVEFRRYDGIYVNNTKVILKGINRHSFWPDGGRTTNREISLQDAKLIKEMNMNAVRVHYPPDVHFWEMCDSLGIFVVDELAGWQNSYKTETGAKLVEEMVIRDRNHPSIIIWSNGNEGGWNKAIDPLFAKYDIQKRHVVHPWADFDGLDTHHYPEYQTGIARFTNGSNVFMPTEFMHGLYDQGHGAGLEDFWNKYKESPLFAGGFMWDFSDNAVRRVDKNNILDTDGNLAADGILGPYREKEASYYSVREIWSPIQIKPFAITSSFDGNIYVTNDYLFSDLEGCVLHYNIYTIDSPLSGTTKQLLIASGNLALPAVSPAETKKIKINLPENFSQGDILEIVALDKSKTEMCTRTFPIETAKQYFAKQPIPTPENSTSLQKTANSVTLKTPLVSVTFDTENGLIKEVVKQNKTIPLTNGPVPVGINCKFKSYKAHTQNHDAIFTAYYEGMLDSVQWRLSDTGLLTMDALMLTRASRSGGFDDATGDDQIRNFGFTFTYPEQDIKGVQWFGRGPRHVWKNRIAGTNFGLWDKSYNNTITGEATDTLVYPEFKGYHANIYWCTFVSAISPFTVYSESNNVFLRLFTPEEPKGNASGAKILPDFPSGDISFLYEIPAIRDFKPVSQHGPKSQPGSIRIKKGDDGIRMILHFDF